MNNFFKQSVKTAKDQAKEMAKKIAREPVEILKTGQNQVTGGSEKKQIAPEISVIDQIITGDGKVKDTTPEEEQAIHAQTKRRLQEIENELRQLRMEREQKSQEYVKGQMELMGENKEEPAIKALEMPQGKKHGGPPKPGQAKKGTHEVGRQAKG